MVSEEEKKLAEELLFSEQKKPSFGKQLFFGRFDAKQVFPYPEAEDAKEFLQHLDRFVLEKIDPAKIDREEKIPESVIKGLADIGMFGTTVPEAFGGRGLSQSTYCQATERIARTCGSTALFVNVQQSIGLKALLLFGTEKQQKQWLPSLAKGEKIAAFSLTEPNAGSDANGIETTAVYDPKKKVYRLNGHKQWTTNGGIADVLTVMAKTEVEGRQKVTAFLVTSDMPGFVVREKALDKVGMRGTWTANLAFNDVEVPEENILGPLGGGLKVCLTVLDYGRVTFGSTCTGAAKELVGRAIAHAKARRQFNRPLATVALVKKKIAMMSAFLYAMEATTYLTAGFIDRDHEDFMLEAAMLKVFASDALWQILYDTMQILGGRSFFTDQPYERMMRDARLNMIGEGSNEVLRAFIGIVGLRDVGVELKEGVDAVKRPLSGFSTVGRTLKSVAGRLLKPKIPIQSKELQKEGKLLATLIRRFSQANIKALARYGEEIIEKQLELDRLATTAMALYTATAVLSRLDHEISSGDTSQLHVGRFYCRYAFREAAQMLKGVGHNCDERIEQLSDEICGY